MLTIQELWEQSTVNTPWSKLSVDRELALIEVKAPRPRIPADHLIFRIFRAFTDPKKQIKVVLLGQDPYPEILEGGITRACGFSFSSPLGTLPKSLRTIFAEMLRDSDGRKPSEYSGDLSYLVADGVFLLNTYLTIASDGTRGYPKTHTCWVTFTTQILNFIRRNCPNVVYLALGKMAADMLKASGITDAIETDHPANRFGSRNPFIGSGIFTRTNALLEKRGVSPIDWKPMIKPIDVNYHNPDIVKGSCVEERPDIEEYDDKESSCETLSTTESAQTE